MSTKPDFVSEWEKTRPDILARLQWLAKYGATYANNSDIERALDELTTLRNQAGQAAEEFARLKEALAGFVDGECHCDESTGGKCVQCVAQAALTPGTE